MTKKKREWLSNRPNVKDIIIQMRDTTELMLDLAYSSLIFKEEHFGEEVLELESKMSDLIFDGEIAVMLSARGMEEVKSLTGILQIFHSSMIISAAAVGLAKIELSDIGLPRAFIKTLHLIEETITSLIVPENSEAASCTVSDIEEKTSMRLIAIKRAVGEWIINPDHNISIYEKDRLIVKGPFEALSAFEVFVVGHHEAFPSLAELKESRDLREIREILIEMMSLSQLSIDLAYSSVIFNNIEIANEVSRIEDTLELLRADLEVKVLAYARNIADVRPLRGLLRIAYSSENLSDASKGISDILFHGIISHPVLMFAMKQSDEIISRVEIESKSVLDGKTIAEYNFEVETGMDIIALYKSKNSKWIYNPKGDILFEANDVLIAKGHPESEEHLLLASRGQDNSENP